MFRVTNYLRRKANIQSAKISGLKVGENTILVGLQHFGSEPYLINIGKNCLITNNVFFVTHDGSIQVPLINSGQRIEDIYAKKSTFDNILIADNVFVGIGSILLPGTKIGNNSIIAAGSVVKGDFGNDVVIAGNPARVVCTINEYFDRNQNRILCFDNHNGNRRSKILQHLQSFK